VVKSEGTSEGAGGGERGRVWRAVGGKRGTRGSEGGGTRRWGSGMGEGDRQARVGSVGWTDGGRMVEWDEGGFLSIGGGDRA